MDCTLSPELPAESGVDAWGGAVKVFIAILLRFAPPGDLFPHNARRIEISSAPTGHFRANFGATFRNR
jgi:hypothetical protein